MSVRRRSFMSRDNTSHAWPKGKISCSICRPYQIEIDYGQNFNWLNTMKQRKITTYVSLVSFLPNLLRMSNGPSCYMGEQLSRKLSSSLTGQFFPKWFLPATHRLWTSEHLFFPKRTGFWCHLTFNNVVKMISNLTLPIVGESVIGWGIVSSIIYHLLIRM